jgi:hypothetical protein
LAKLAPSLARAVKILLDRTFRSTLGGY